MQKGRRDRMAPCHVAMAIRLGLSFLGKMFAGDVMAIRHFRLHLALAYPDIVIPACATAMRSQRRTNGHHHDQHSRQQGFQFHSHTLAGMQLQTQGYAL